MSDNILLSICIPTYNRIEYIKALIPRIYASISGNNSIEVIVYDNCSTDGTWGILNEFAGIYDGFHCYQQNYNVGIDRNMIDVMMKSNGKYVHPLGDDDFYDEGGLTWLLDFLQKDDFDLLVFNALHVDKHLNSVRRHLGDNLLNVKYTKPETAFVCLWNKMPFGSFAFNRKYLNIREMEKYLGTSHAYTGFLWDSFASKMVLNSNLNIITLAESIVMLRGGEKTWLDDVVEIKLKEIPYWFFLLPKYYDNIKKKTLHHYYKSNLSIINLLMFRSSGKLSMKNVTDLVQYMSLVMRIKVYSFVFIPRAWAALLIRLIKSC